MFKKIYTINELKSGNINKDFSEIKNEEALQILQKGSNVKVVLTQERYFELLRIESILKNESYEPVWEKDSPKNKLEMIKEKIKLTVQSELDIERMYRIHVSNYLTEQPEQQNNPN